MIKASPHGCTMTERERMEAAYRGEEVDRVPIWLREGFPVLDGPADKDDFRFGWQADETYRRLFHEIAPCAAVISGWTIPGVNRRLMTPPDIAEPMAVENPSSEIQRRGNVIHTPRGDLTKVVERKRNVACGWTTKYPVTCLEDLLKLKEVTFKVEEEQIEQAVDMYKQTEQAVGDRGIPQLCLSSPIVCISGAMPFELFLELSVTEPHLMHELCAENTRHILALLDRLFARDIEFRTTANLGGSEQCTPPMMHPEAFDEFVVPYDGQIVERLHRESILVKMHCHGKVRHALRCMRQMGIDATDPVEPPPAGDLAFSEAREIAGDDVTLVGNLEFDELELEEPDHIRARVKEILTHGKRGLVLGASAGPISRIRPQLADNYRAWIETALEYGQ